MVLTVKKYVFAEIISEIKEKIKIIT